MKKQLILALGLLTGGLALPAAAQHRGHSQSRHHVGQVQVFISGYRSCGTPIYAKRVRYGRHFQVEPLTGYELRCYLERQRRIAAQRAYERRLIRERYLRSRYLQGGRHHGRCR